MKRADLPIPTPCHEDWDTMTVVGKTLFCAACKKHVHDLTRMTEAEAREVLARRGAEELCVRYLHDAYGDLVFRMVAPPLVPPSRLAGAKRALALGASIAGVSAIAACASAPPPQAEMYGGAVACPTEAPTSPTPSGTTSSAASGAPEATAAPSASGPPTPTAK